MISFPFRVDTVTKKTHSDWECSLLVMTVKLFLRVSLDCYCIYFFFLVSCLASPNAVRIEEVISLARAYTARW